MNIDQLVRMANSIGDYFVSHPDRAEAEASIARHIRMNWTPRMRAALYAHTTAETAVPATAEAAPKHSEEIELRPIVRSAIRAHAQHFLPPPSERESVR